MKRKVKIDIKNLIVICIITLLSIITNFFIKKTIIGILVLYAIIYAIFLIYSYIRLKSLKKMILSAEVIFETVFFMYSVPAAIMFVLDGYQPRVTFFLIDTDTILRTLLLYFNINCILLILMLINNIKTIELTESEIEQKFSTNIKFDIWDAIALITTIYFVYLYLRNGLEIFSSYFHTIRELIQSNIHNFNSYIYLFMIPYSFINIGKIIYENKENVRNIGKQRKTKKIFLYFILILFWGFSVLTDRRNLINLLMMILMIYVLKIKKIGLKRMLAIFVIIILFLSKSYFRSGTNSKNINDIIFLSNGEFILSHYVSEYYINNCDKDLKYGSTYIYDTLVSWIPKSVYKNKPEMLSNKFKEDAKTNVAYAFNPVAEGLINFGEKGALFLVPLTIYIYIKIAYILRKKSFLYYIVICAYSINIFRGIFSTSVFAISVMLLFTFAMLTKIKK